MTKDRTTGESTGDRVKDALERDIEQTKADLPGMEGKDLDQDADDTIRQAVGKEPIPPKNVPSD